MPGGGGCNPPKQPEARELRLIPAYPEQALDLVLRHVPNVDAKVGAADRIAIISFPLLLL